MGENEYSCKECKEPTTPIIFENELAYARLSKIYFAPGHMLVLPKNHAKCLEDLTQEERKAMDNITSIIKQVLLREFSYKNFVIWENDGPSRSVEHYHRHVLPGDKINDTWPVNLNFVKKLSSKEIKELTKKLKNYTL